MKIDFYLISNQVADAKFKLASRLSNKLQRLSQKTLVVTNDEQQRDHLDKIMWSFSDTSFVAHELYASQNTICCTQLVTKEDLLKEPPSKNYDVLINLADSTPEVIDHFSRIAEIIECEEPAKASGRLRYKHYQELGFELDTHPIEL